MRPFKSSIGIHKSKADRGIRTALKVMGENSLKASLARGKLAAQSRTTTKPKMSAISSLLMTRLAHIRCYTTIHNLGTDYSFPNFRNWGMSSLSPNSPHLSVTCSRDSVIIDFSNAP